ncbi:MAG: GDSL-type esterase/lipase family protein [Pirellulaceae bacterium]
MIPFRSLVLLNVFLSFSLSFTFQANAQSSSHAVLRGQLDHSRIKFQLEKRGSVAFIGGSITEMNGYRPMVMEYLQQRFPETEFTFTNAGISSTCSTTGAFRFQRDVISVKPDLLFVEFAVNDDQDAAHSARDCVRGMEGIIRHARTNNPNIDIVMTHFVNPSMLQKAQEGKQATSVAQHERVADHYQVSSVNVPGELADQIKSGNMTWERFGGTHPKDPGNRMVADKIIETLDAAWKTNLPDDATAKPHRLPEPLDTNSYFQGRLVHVDQAKLDDDWMIKTPDWKSLPGGKRDRFNELKLLCATRADATLILDFTGKAIGAFVLAGPDAGQLDYSIDGSPFKTVDLYHRYSKGLHYPRTVMFDADLSDSPHQLALRVSKSRNAGSQGTAARIMEFVVN